MDEIEQIEQFMADFIMRESPEDAREFIDAISQDGITQAEVDEVRAVAVEALSNPETFPAFVQYLLRAGLIEEEPQEYDPGFVMSILGLVGIAQSLVTTS
jgi:hypothetical protein